MSAARTITVEGMVISGNVYYIHSDHLEMPREITNERNFLSLSILLF
ncbi:MAG: hypothetical protein LBD67_07970 [Candidatus Accumulibacter sp.]|nr:hypothetical protein [Accumulibacter sp.]